jgi:hypothetical protein
MKNLFKNLTVMAAVLALAATAYAGDCCVKASKDAKEGKTCEKCATEACCKEAIKKLGKDAKECTACAAKKKDS